MTLLYRISGSLAAFSAGGSLLVILSYLSNKGLRKHYSSVMVLCLCICDLLFSLKFIITALTPDSKSIQHQGGAWCDSQAYWGQFWGVASISWNGMISLNVIINLKNPFVNMRPYIKFLHIWVWGLAAATTIILIAWGDVGPSGDGTCWLRNPQDPFRLLFFLPLLMYFTLGVVALIMSVMHLHQIRNPLVFKTSERRSLYVRMILYVVVFIACWTGPMIHRTWELAGLSDLTNPGVMAYIDNASLSVQGFANAIVWLSSPTFVNIVKKWLRPKRDGYVEYDNNKQGEEEHDVHTLNNVSRRNVIACLLQGVAAQGKAQLGGSRDVEEGNSGCRISLSSSSKSVEIIDFAKESGASNDKCFQFMDYLPSMFAKIREVSGISTECYLESLNPAGFLSGTDNIKVSDGKSGSFFCFSADKKFILKTIQPEEAELLNNVLAPLLDYFLSNKDSLISRFYGFHGVKVPGGNIIHMVVMANVFNTMNKIHECYDLKGSWVDRCVGEEHEKHPSKLGLDLDLKRKLSMPENIKNLFLKQIASDSRFMCRLGIMDYSLLLGFHFSDSTVAQTDPEKLRWNQGVTSTDGHAVYYMGVIDILQMYNFRKKAEKFAKSYLLNKDKKGISAVPPPEYSNRFIRAMEHIVD